MLLKGDNERSVVTVRPLRKKKSHRRSPWACDECRLRKRKCDGVQPCAPCQTDSLACGYHFRRPAAPPTQRIRMLEDHVRVAHSFIQDLQAKVPPLPGVDFETVLRMIDFTLPETSAKSSTCEGSSNQPRLSSMMTGWDRFTRTAPWATSFYGTSSELSFILRILEMFQKPGRIPYAERFLVVAGLFDLSMPRQEAMGLLPYRVLPPRNTALSLVDALFARCHPLLTFLHEQHFREMVELVYALTPSPTTALDRFIPLLHFAFALGYLFKLQHHRDNGCQSALQEATKQFCAGQDMVHLPYHNDLTSLQSLLCAIVFLFTTSRIASAHPLIGIACSMALRLGLHSGATANINLLPQECKARTLVLASVLKLDLYASLILGLPPFIQRDAVDLSYITILTATSEKECDFETATSLKHLILLEITWSSQKSVFTKEPNDGLATSTDVKHFEDAERAFRGWKEDLSSLLAKMGDSGRHTIMKYELEMSYTFAQIVLFRPLLHYLQIVADGGTISLMQSQHALACIKLASTSILRSEVMIKKGLLHPGSWAAVYTVFSSVMCLIYLIAAHNGTSQPSQAWQRAALGIRLIAACKCVDNCAAAGLQVLKMVTSELSHTVEFNIDRIESSVVRLCRSNVEEQNMHLQPQALILPPNQHVAVSTDMPSMERVESTSSANVDLQNEADKMLAQAEELPMEFGFSDLLNLADLN